MAKKPKANKTAPKKKAVAKEAEPKAPSPLDIVKGEHDDPASMG